MSEARAILATLIEEGISARAHFQIWWALRNLAIPRFLQTMNNPDYVDFFHASNAGHYKLFVLALAKIFDRDSRVAGLREFRRALKDEGRNDMAKHIDSELHSLRTRITAILNIRNKSLVHNERALQRAAVYKVNGITPNQIRELIDKTCDTINYAARDLGISSTIFDSTRGERATLRMLEALERGNI